jgi:cytochrome o ubiquinol oxidase subunit 2
MNSFFIPQLGGQIYAMAGMETKLHLIANEAGTYKGMSANYSGAGFSGMKFNAIATETPSSLMPGCKRCVHRARP